MSNLLEKEGKKVVLLGNEALVRGAIESGLGFASAYPGTPSSEVGDTFNKIHEKLGFYFEYGTNEKVATEVAGMAAWSGLKTMVSMKHFGLNVASDGFLPIVYAGVKGAMVVNVADDPGCLSSGQSEQDSRYYSRMGKFPLLEPANSSECKELTKKAFEISSKYGIPVCVRTTTRVAHGRGVVNLGKIDVKKPEGEFERDPEFIIMPPKVLEQHKKVLDKLEKIRLEFAEKSDINFVVKGSGSIGVIASGIGYEYARECMKELGLKAPVLKLGLSFPLAKDKISKFVAGLDKVLIVEELDGILEKDIKALGLDVEVHGKDLVPEVDELNVERLMPAFSELFGKKLDFDFKKHKEQIAKVKVSKRPPIFCQGCPHRATYWIMKQVYGNDAIYGGDIGCYLMASSPPISQADYITCMGGGVSLSHGLSKVTDKKVVDFIGDSTFFHAGIPGLVNMVFNKSNAVLVVLDNRITAMTGHQPRVGVCDYRPGDKTCQTINVEDVARALGVKNVEVIDPFNIKKSIETVKKLKEKNELAVVVSREPCRLVWLRDKLKKGEKFTRWEIDQDKCIKCGTCLLKFGCPAIKRENGKYEITDLCWGCSCCAQVCPVGAIKPKK